LKEIREEGHGRRSDKKVRKTRLEKIRVSKNLNIVILRYKYIPSSKGPDIIF